MNYKGLDDFLNSDRLDRMKGPVAMIFVEDLIEVDTTIRHHQQLGFSDIIVFAPTELNLPRDLARAVHRVPYSLVKTPFHEGVNRVTARAPDLWMYYCFNAEYLFFPFCETRNVREMLHFNTEERREAVLTFVVDLYAGDLHRHGTAVSLEQAFFDKSGYYALARDGEGGPKERQLDFFGGLRWRFEEHVPKAKRRIDRVSLFKAKPGLTLLPNHTFNDEEYNTYSCGWHNNLTAAVCSFRTAKALKLNPGSTFDIQSFRWHNSVPFAWESQQLMDLGLMEPGQWF